MAPALFHECDSRISRHKRQADDVRFGSCLLGLVELESVELRQWKLEQNLTALAPLVVEVNAGDDLYSNDRRGRDVDHQTERGPPASVGNKPSAVLPEVFDTVASETSNE